MKYRELEKEAIEKFLKVRKENPQVILTMELCENGFWIRIFKKKRDNFHKPIRYADNEVECLYAQNKILEIFEELEEKIKILGG